MHCKTTFEKCKAAFPNIRAYAYFDHPEHGPNSCVIYCAPSENFKGSNSVTGTPLGFHRVFIGCS